MASDVATLALKVAAIAAALAMLVVPSSGRCPSLGPAPPSPPMQASPPPPPPPSKAYASPPPPPFPTPPPPPSPPPAQASPPPPPVAAQPAPAPGPAISCGDCFTTCDESCYATNGTRCIPGCNSKEYSCGNNCKMDVIKSCKAGGTCADGRCDCDNDVDKYSSGYCDRECANWSWFCQSCWGGLSRECGENCARQCHLDGCVEP